MATVEADRIALKAPKNKEKKRSIAPIIISVILLLIVGAAVAVVGFNVFNLRDRYLTGILRNIPIVNNLLPAETAPDPTETATKEELLAQISQLERTLRDREDQITQLNEKSNMYLTELERLQDIETQQAEIKQQKADFDKMIATNDPMAYQAFYESVDPTNAEQLYKEVVGVNQASAEINQYISAFTSMDATAAAAILEQLVSGDLNLVVDILSRMDAASRGEILAAMTPPSAAAVSKRAAPNFNAISKVATE